MFQRQRDAGSLQASLVGELGAGDAVGLLVSPRRVADYDQVAGNLGVSEMGQPVKEVCRDCGKPPERSPFVYVQDNSPRKELLERLAFVGTSRSSGEYPAFSLALSPFCLVQDLFPNWAGPACSSVNNPCTHLLNTLLWYCPGRDMEMNQSTNYASGLNRQAKAQTAAFRVSIEIECTFGKFAGQRRVEESIFRSERGAKADLAYRTRANELPGESKVISSKMEAL